MPPFPGRPAGSDAVGIKNRLRVEDFSLRDVASVSGVIAEALRVRRGHRSGERDQLVDRDEAWRVFVQNHWRVRRKSKN